jgi:hypothetical protein
MNVHMRAIEPEHKTSAARWTGSDDAQGNHHETLHNHPCGSACAVQHVCGCTNQHRWRLGWRKFDHRRRVHERRRHRKHNERHDRHGSRQRYRFHHDQQGPQRHEPVRKYTRSERLAQRIDSDSDGPGFRYGPITDQQPLAKSPALRGAFFMWQRDGVQTAMVRKRCLPSGA